MTDHDSRLHDLPRDRRVAQYLMLDKYQRPEGSHPAVRLLMMRPRTHGADSRRLVEYIRIARRHEV